MNYFASILRNLFRRRRVENELDAEMQSHLQLLADEKMARGASPAEARRAARLEMDGVESVREGVRDARAGAMLEQVFQDLRYGVRVLRASPMFTLVAVLSLALGIGANTAIFSVVNAVLFRPLPYAEPDRLMMIWERDNKGLPDNATYTTWHDWRAQSKSFQDIALVSSWLPPLTEGGQPEQLVGLRVTNNFFRLLGVRPIIGRDFTPEEDNPSGRTVMLSYNLWRRRFGADPSIAGKTISIAEIPFVVAGVLPPDFPPLIAQGIKGEQPEIYRILGYDLSLPWACRSCHHLNAVGRLRPGVSRKQAEAELSSIQAALYRAFPKDMEASSVIVQTLQDYIVGPVTPTLRLLLAAVGFVLLLACVNLSNLMLARSAVRRREMAVRAALGAGRGRVIRQLLTENSLVALIAAVLGLIPAIWAAAMVRALGGGDIPRLAEVHLDARVLLFCAALALLTGIASGLLPALRLSRASLDDDLKAGARGSGASSRANATLVAIEVCFSLILLVGAGLVLRSLMLVLAVDPGFNPDHVLTMRVSLVGKTYEKGEAVRLFYQQAMERIAALPGVQGAAASSQIPLSGNVDRYGFHAVGKSDPGHPETDPPADRYTVTPGYLRTMAIPVLKGRDLERTDVAGTQQVILINQAAAKRIWPGEDPLGKQVKFGDPKLPAWTIVGVVGDVHHDALDQAPQLQFYVPHAQWPDPDGDMSVVVRTGGDPDQMAAPVEQAIHSVDALQPISHVATLDRLIGMSVVSRRLVLSLLGGFALLALVLAAVGVYGVAAYGVAQRTREIGIRMALGATPSSVLRMVLGEGLRLALAGVALGIVLAAAATRLVAGMLFGVKPTDPATFACVTVLLLAAALAASWIPALRATRIQPQSALRHE